MTRKSCLLIRIRRLLLLHTFDDIPLHLLLYRFGLASGLKLLTWQSCLLVQKTMSSSNPSKS
ncbi:uncharacterized protein PHALS_15412 [Plasmopara halstedii]|uniref:Uncharacterized protein n=1 Tax=Plasmopara halstedii TaxID=4781 RepID=A0A0P1AGY3_PLAHL|nr:uncharacterized protein PHALS_15412 [Plasmopara halstedii]CEG39904.1 hypothetical protein PHALS_15412 [Plasmopara halstedii]|eukprot:XP_024576273.1 hypothetical protein PHALS_15412 [Plasmopara halstedii]